MMSNSQISATVPVGGLITALVIAVALGVSMVRLWQWIAYAVPRDCPYCGSSDLIPVRRLSPDKLQSLCKAALRLRLATDMAQGYLCRSCLRVADPAIAVSADPASYWVLVPKSHETPNPGEVVAYPPLHCRRCGKEYVLSGGPQEFRVCHHCNAAHDWWSDEETGYSFFVADKEEANG